MSATMATRPPIGKIRRLRASRDALAVMLTAVIGADVDQAAAAELRAREHRETFAAGWAAGYRARQEAEARERDAAWGRLTRRLAGPTFTAIEAARWELRGSPRTRATFGDPHPDDFPGTEGR